MVIDEIHVHNVENELSPTFKVIHRSYTRVNTNNAKCKQREEIKNAHLNSNNMDMLKYMHFSY